MPTGKAHRGLSNVQWTCVRCDIVRRTFGCDPWPFRLKTFLFQRLPEALIEHSFRTRVYCCRPPFQLRWQPWWRWPCENDCSLKSYSKMTRNIGGKKWIWKISMFFRCISKTLNGRLPHEDSSDFDDFWTELIVITWSIIRDKLRLFRFFLDRNDRHDLILSFDPLPLFIFL